MPRFPRADDLTARASRSSGHTRRAAALVLMMMRRMSCQRPCSLSFADCLDRLLTWKHVWHNRNVTTRELISERPHGAPHDTCVKIGYVRWQAEVRKSGREGQTYYCYALWWQGLSSRLRKQTNAGSEPFDGARVTPWR